MFSREELERLPLLEEDDAVETTTGVDGASSVEQDTVAVTVHELSTSSQPQPKGLLAFDPLGKTGAQQGDVRECRICQEEASSEDGPLVAPCACSGSMRFIHPRCLQRWITEKGDAVCEVCQQPFQGEWEVPRPMRFDERAEQEQLLAAFAQGMNARLRPMRMAPQQQQRQTRFAKVVEASISMAMMVYMSLFLLHVASTGDSDHEVPRAAEVAERILTLLLQVVYVTMTMLFAVHVVATLVYRVVQRAWTQVRMQEEAAIERILEQRSEV